MKLFKIIFRKRKPFVSKPCKFTVTWDVNGYFEIKSEGNDYGVYGSRDAVWKSFLIFMRRRLNEL